MPDYTLTIEAQDLPYEQVEVLSFENDAGALIAARDMLRRDWVRALVGRGTVLRSSGSGLGIGGARREGR